MAEQALERALFDRLIEFPEDFSSNSDVIARFAPALAEVAAYYGSLTSKKRRHDLPDAQMNSLRNVVGGGPE